MDMVKFVIFGAIVGVANIIPGVSGGTMAVILKIYDRLIETLSLKNVKKNLPFIIPLGIGAAVGIVLFSKAIEFLLGNYPMATNFTFMGLILGSIPIKWRPREWFPSWWRWWSWWSSRCSSPLNRTRYWR